MLSERLADLIARNRVPGFGTSIPKHPLPWFQEQQAWCYRELRNQAMTKGLLCAHRGYRGLAWYYQPTGRWVGRLAGANVCGLFGGKTPHNVMQSFAACVARHMAQRATVIQLRAILNQATSDLDGYLIPRNRGIKPPVSTDHCTPMAFNGLRVLVERLEQGGQAHNNGPRKLIALPLAFMPNRYYFIYKREGKRNPHRG